MNRQGNLVTRGTGECSIATCSKPAKYRGWCEAHYERWRRHGDPLKGGPMHKNPEHVLEEVEWFLSFGVHPALIATQLNMTVTALERVCQRHGRAGWAALFRHAA